MNVDLSLSRHDEGTYLEFPRKTEEQDRVNGTAYSVGVGSTAENLVDFTHILDVLDSEVNSPRQSYQI